jgi:hypothetical protein
MTCSSRKLTRAHWQNDAVASDTFSHTGGTQIFRVKRIAFALLLFLPNRCEFEKQAKTLIRILRNKQEGD